MSGLTPMYAKRVKSEMADLKTSLLSFNKEALRWCDPTSLDEMADEVEQFELTLKSFAERMRARASLQREGDCIDEASS